MDFNDLQSFERLTGLAFFTPAGAAGAIPLGNITMLKVDYGTKAYEPLKSLRGVLQRRRRDTYGHLAIYSIDGNQFATPMIPLLLLGTKTDDFAQSAATAQTFTFTAAAGLAFFAGAYSLANVVVKVSGVTKTIGTDYFLDDPNVPQIGASMQGCVIIPVDTQGIQEGDVVTVTFDQAALVMDQYLAFTQLSQTGLLQVFAEDEAGGPGREVWIMTVQLTCKKGADIDPTKFRSFTLEAAIIGNPAVMKPGGTSLLSIGVGGDTFLV
jgi:hypothetical protein